LRAGKFPIFPRACFANELHRSYPYGIVARSPVSSTVKAGTDSPHVIDGHETCRLHFLGVHAADEAYAEEWHFSFVGCFSGVSPVTPIGPTNPQIILISNFR
jgi:hypothetical protein